MPTLADLAQMLGMGSTPTPPRRPNIYPRPAPSIAEAPSEWDSSMYGYGPDAYGRMTRAKGSGWMGPQQTPYGDTMTELSIGVPIFGTEMEIPTMVPTLTPAQVQTLLALQDGQPIPDDILKAAVKHAEMRVLQGQSPFAQPGDTRQKRKP